MPHFSFSAWLPLGLVTASITPHLLIMIIIFISWVKIFLIWRWKFISSYNHSICVLNKWNVAYLLLRFFEKTVFLFAR
ncbi:Uncharacterised protein [Serratia grimesii]|nr:hypothetical protein 348p1_00117 [Serratia grimesii]CAI2793460.1 Uncharacterised protein [Serratia grimesii]